MLKVAIVAVSLYVLAGCIDTGVCSRCLLPRSDDKFTTATGALSATASSSQVSGQCKPSSKNPVIKVVDQFPEAVMYALVSILAAFIFSKTGKVNGFLSYLTTQIYDRCSSGKRRVLAIINSIIWRNRK